jgi:hypothetical protein
VQLTETRTICNDGTELRFGEATNHGSLPYYVQQYNDGISTKTGYLNYTEYFATKPEAFDHYMKQLEYHGNPVGW